MKFKLILPLITLVVILAASFQKMQNLKPIAGFWILSIINII